ncbi:tripartite tricarboxylate transporter TctB family protein [Pseudomonas massiliensis]|uniref:tripartite tricarboxylate transporter TctB family protein n=1 Tax=Pseudomonas massiliensis TaxID=522492 RepID=UPI00058CA9C7|nr:tripartite tricarboxylate transporter TctB family protein [Pseudomonas massiliensis]
MNTLQRAFAAVLLLACAALAIMAWPYQAAFSYEPVGPRAYPLLLLTLLGIAALYMLIRPAAIVHGEDEPQLDRHGLLKIVACIGLLLLFAGLFEPLGFILSSVLIGVPMARLYGGRWMPALLVIPLTALALYILFDRLMDVPLPLGLLSLLEN